MIIEFFIPGKMTGKKSAQTIKAGWTFKHPDTERFENKVSLFASQAMKGRSLVTGAVKLEVNFILPRPKYHFGTGKNTGRIKDKYIDAPHIVKPDLKNLIASIEDGCNKIVWRDDCQIYGYGETYKRYADDGDQLGCVVRIETKQEGD